MEDLYLEIYEKFSKYPAEADCRITRNAIAWLLSAQRKLSSAEFLYALSITPNEDFSPVSKDQVLDICCNLVVFDGTLDTFRFARLSVREFLEKKPEYEIMSVNFIVAETCLRLLIATAQSLVVKRIMPEEPQPSAARPLLAGDSRKYPTLYWASRCHLAGDKRCDGVLKDLLSRFVCNESDLASPFAIWAN